MFKEVIKKVRAEFSYEMNLDEEVAGRVRATQLASMVQTKFFMMVTSLISATAVFSLVSMENTTMSLCVWYAVMCLHNIMGISHWFKIRDKVYKKTASEKGIRKNVIHGAVLGSLWGILPIMVYPGGTLAAQLVVVATGCGMMGGSAIALNKMPKPLIGVMVPLCIGLMFAFIVSGRPVDIAIGAMLVCFAFACVKGAIGISKNFVESRVALYENKKNAETISMLLSDLTESANDWLWETDLKGNVVRGHEQFSSHLDLDEFSFCPNDISQECRDVASSSETRVRKQIWTALNNGQAFKSLSFPVSSKAGAKWLSISGKPLWDEEGNFVGFRGVASDITEIKNAEERIAFLAYNDALTGLVNRANFTAVVEQKFKKQSVGWAVMYMDLDGFKQINDQHGHAAGDQILIEVGKRIKKIVKDSDVIARLGGDEFALMLNSASSVSALSDIAEKILNKIGDKYIIEGAVTEVSASIGIAIAGKDGINIEQIMNNADLALYRAKAEGRAAYRFYEIEMDEVVKKRRVMENDLREAIRQNELTISFQALVSSQGEKTTGFEALVRWNHPVHGNVPPSEFIPLAERIGVVSQIGDWVLMEACRQAVTWPNDITVAVNLSPQQFYDNRIIDIVKHCLDITGLAPHRLELEITEGLFIDNADQMLIALNKLKEVGVSIALDDFGTGYSSLSHLLKFPFDKLKIDKSLISSINEDDVARDVLESIAKLGSILNLNVTAEGVETADQLKLLKDMDCTHFQGFHFSKPLDGNQLSAYLLNEVVSKSVQSKKVRSKKASVAKSKKQSAA